MKKGKPSLRENLFKKMVRVLNARESTSWFDLGLFLDQLQENRKLPENPVWRETDFIKQIGQGIAFITFDYGIDGVSIEVAKYARALESIIAEAGSGKKPDIYWVAETFKWESKTVIEPRWKRYVLKGAGGFVDWGGYNDLFHTKLARGSDEYNTLIRKIWNQARALAADLGRFVIDRDIQLLFPVNACSNPGNVSLALAIVLVSEYLNIPVFNNSHDFFWEDGKPAWERKGHGGKGLRDHFFRNADIGEVMSLIHTLYPWDSPLWFQSVLNKAQRRKLTYHYGFSPAMIATIPTIIDTRQYKMARTAQKEEILNRLQCLFSNREKNHRTKSVEDYRTIPEGWHELNRPLFLGSRKGIRYDLTKNNILFLQPTRILARKRIERNFMLIEMLLQHPPFQKIFEENPDMTITHLITGPVTREHTHHLEELISEFRDLLKDLPRKYRERVFGAFRFGIESGPIFKKLRMEKIKIHEIYAAANMVLLPSKTEGRGLPLLEASACGVPIFTSRYAPEKTFREVVGEDLEESLQLRVLEFPEGDTLPEDILDQVTDHLFNKKVRNRNTQHNISVVEERFGTTALRKSLRKSIGILCDNLYRNREIKAPVKKAFRKEAEGTRYDGDFRSLTLSRNRRYLSGITELEYMVYLRSLIDPSYFRMEEKELRARVFRFALKMVFHFGKYMDKQTRLKFYRQVDYVFTYNKGEDEQVVDHSLSYRHRHRKHYYFRKKTEPELCGIVVLLFSRLVKISTHSFPWQNDIRLGKNLEKNIRALVPAKEIAIDDTPRMAADLRSRKPVAWFPGRSFEAEATVFVEQTLLKRLGFKPEKKLTEKDLDKRSPEITGTVTLFTKETGAGDSLNHQFALGWVKNYAPQNIRLLYNKGFFRIVQTRIISLGIHLAQFGKEAAAALREIKDRDGFVVTSGKVNMISLDLLDMPRYCLGISSLDFHAGFMGIKRWQGFILWMPAALRPSLAFPTPIQTPREFSENLKSNKFKKCVKKMGEKKLLSVLREDADRFGTPVGTILENLLEKKSARGKKSAVESKLLTGLHSNGAPWSGAYAKISFARNARQRLKFYTGFADAKGDTVLSIMKAFEKKEKKQVLLGWNGGYILNPELVGKLGLPEDYIGSPLGLLINHGRMLSLPLYRKPALTFLKNGEIQIREADLKNGMEVIGPEKEALLFTPEMRNNTGTQGPAFFDLMMDDINKIPGRDRVVYRFAGNRIIEVIRNHPEEVPILPVGVTVSMPAGAEPKAWDTGTTVEFHIKKWEDTDNAIEAGPLLIRDGRESIEMEEGGWKSNNSILTQAARVDFTHMRGPKIGVGLTRDKHLIVAAVNGRIRESVGATHGELAKILLDMGAVEGMGFDPGGSVTLVVNHQQLNISPYNKDFLQNPYSLPPQPRFIGNALMGVLAGR